jgi:hypothetical protein
LAEGDTGLKKDTRSNTFAFTPSREFLVVIDPRCIQLLLDTEYLQVLRLVQRLRLVDPPVTIHLLVAKQLMDLTLEPIVDKLTPPLSKTTPGKVPSFTPHNDIPQQHREYLLADSDESHRNLSLLALADTIQADGIVTNITKLIDARYVLSQYHRIRIIPLSEFGDTVEILAHGHFIFLSSSALDKYVTFDLFYQWTHWKNARIAKWFAQIENQTTNMELREALRSALLNRYPFLLYARDMIRFFDFQMDFYARRGLWRRFSMGVGFYVTNFYLLLWGMLDHLTIIAKWARNLTIDEKYCGIRSKDFWKEFGKQEPQLRGFLKSNKITKWISLMADMRHAAAHRTLALPTPLLEETEESQKSDEDILKAIRKERSHMYAVLPEEIMKAFEPQMIWHWKVEKMKVIAPSMVYIKGEEGRYIRDPIVNVDYDLQYLTAIMDAFLVVLFR